MKPIELKYMCRPVIQKLPIDYYENEIFVSMMYKLGIFTNYAISNYGRIYSFYINKILKPFIDERNYSRIQITVSNKRRFIGVHFLELMSFCPIYDDKNIFVPNHKDGNPQNNLLSNLEWATISENTIHAIELGLANCKCENNSRSIFTNNEVHFICSLLEKKKSISEILNILGLEYGNERNKVAAIIRLIRRGQTYLDISSQYNIPGIKGRVYYPPEMTLSICEKISKRQYRIDELCDEFNIALDDRKMFINFVQDVTRRQKDTYISSNYSILYSPLPIPKNHPQYDYYY